MRPIRITGRDGTEMTIRRAVAADAEAFVAGWQRVADERQFLSLRHVRVTPAQMAARFEDGDDLTIVGEVAGRLAAALGILRLGSTQTEHRGELGMWILPEHRGQRFGAALIQYAESWAKSVGIERIELGVFPENVRAIRLYERLGFELEGRIRDAFRYADDGVTYRDVILMAKSLRRAGRSYSAKSGKTSRAQRSSCSRS